MWKKYWLKYDRDMATGKGTKTDHQVNRTVETKEYKRFCAHLKAHHKGNLTTQDLMLKLFAILEYDEYWVGRLRGLVPPHKYAEFDYAVGQAMECKDMIVID